MTTMTMTDSDRVREHVFQHYISPARRVGNPTVTVRAGDVANALGLSGWLALVCSALAALKFQRDRGIWLEASSSPGNRVSTTFMFRVWA